MFRTTLSKSSTLDKAIVACVAAMLGFNALVLASQLQAAPHLALIRAEAKAAQA